MNLRKYAQILTLLFVVGIFPAVCGQSCGGGGGGGGGDVEIPIPQPNIAQVQQLSQLENGDVIVYTLNGVTDTYMVIGGPITSQMGDWEGSIQSGNYKQTTVVILMSSNGQEVTVSAQQTFQTPIEETELESILAADFEAQLDDPEGDE